MKITLLVVGKTTDAHIQALLQDYQKRLGHYVPFTLTVIPELKNTKSLTSEQQKQAEGELIFLHDNCGEVVLDKLLIETLKELYPESLTARYKMTDFEDLDGYELLMLLGRKRGFVVSGGEIDTERAAKILLDEFRGAKLGNISLERPSDFTEE